MIKPEQIPDEVWQAARLELVDGPLREDMEDRYRHAIAAALNAWPGIERVPGDHEVKPYLILPLPQEKPDDKA